MIGGQATILIMVLIQTLFLSISGFYKEFQIFPNRSRLSSVDVTNDDLTVVVAEDDGVKIFSRTNS